MTPEQEKSLKLMRHQLQTRGVVLGDHFENYRIILSVVDAQAARIKELEDRLEVSKMITRAANEALNRGGAIDDLAKEIEKTETLELRVFELEAALRDLLTWFSRPTTSEPQYVLPAGEFGADEAIGEARRALSGPPKTQGET